MPSDTAWAAPSSWLRSAGCINARHHRGCACGLRVSGTRNDQTSVGACEREASVHLETWASPGESPAHRSSEWCHKPVWSGAPHVCATIVAACMCACPRHYRGAMGPLDVYEPFGGGYSRCGGPCGGDMSVSVLAVAYVIIHLCEHESVHLAAGPQHFLLNAFHPGAATSIAGRGTSAATSTRATSPCSTSPISRPRST